VKQIRKLVTALVVLTLASLAQAQGSKVFQDGRYWVEETSGTINSARNVKVIADAGAVRVQGTGQPNVNYLIRKRVVAGSEQDARRQFDKFRVTATNSGDTAIIKGTCMNDSGRSRLSVNYEIETPQTVGLVYMRSGGGGLTVNNINGRVDGETGGGDIRLDAINGPVSATSGGGTIEIGTVGGDLKVETGGGDIRIRMANGELNAQSGGGNIWIESSAHNAEVETGGGAIEIHRVGGALRAESGGGDLDIGDVGGAASVETGGGGIRLASAKGAVRAETGGGNISLSGLWGGVNASSGAGSITAEFVGKPANMSESRLETSVGNIRVWLPSGFPVSVDASVDVGQERSIESDFPELKIRSEGDNFGPREVYAKGAINGGGASLKINTNTGSIQIRKK
jgi:DUF4097 and DUF4098 domain-containing protein YvlB